MGYYTTMEISVEIKKEKINEFRSLIESKRNDDTELSQNFLQDIKVNEDGSLEFEECYGRHYGDKDFVKLLAPFVEEGYVEFFGDDGARWGYHFCGDGRVKHIVYESKIKGFFIK